MRYLAGTLAIIVLCLSPPVSAQELSPFIVDGPRFSRTAFTNWDRIDLTYTLRWAEGYEPMYDDMKPENMDFSPLMIDTKSDPSKLELLNQRSYKREFREYYIEVVYHLRYAAEKKGEITIAPQVFRYRKIQAGKDKDSMEVLSFKTEKFNLPYYPTLTEDAFDIKDTIDFGSFSGQANGWYWGSIGSFVLLSSLALFLIFRKSILVVDTISAEAKTAGISVITSQDHLAELAKAGQKLVRACRDDAGSNEFYNAVVGFNSAIRSVLEIYVPGVTDASTSPEIQASINMVSFSWLKHKLQGLKMALNSCEAYLYKVDRHRGHEDDKEPYDIHTQNLMAYAMAVKDYVKQLKPSNVAWQKQLWKFKNKPLLKPLRRLMGWS